MILLKVLLSESQIAAYEQPVGTLDMECGAGLNCMFCTLKMLGVYSPEIEKMSLTCSARHAEGKPIKAKELIPAIKEAVKAITDEEHEFKFDVITGDPTSPLSALVADLKPQEACFFIYGRNGNGSHAVVLRRGSDGILELIDPQRGQADFGKEFGFTAARAAELGLEVKSNYYRVRGEEEITTVMIEQSALFKYWPSKEAVESNIHNFVIGTLLVDNVVGLKMLIDDHKDTSTMMDVEEMVVPNPRMDVEMEGGGPGDKEEYHGYSTVESDAIRIPLGKKLKKEDVGRLVAIHETPNPEDDWTDALIQELSYTTKDDEMFTPKYVDLMETTEDGEEIITRTFLDEYGNPKGEPKILDNTLEGGGPGKKRGRNPTPTEGPARQRRRTDLTLDDLKRTPEQKRIAEQIVDTVMTPGKEGITAAIDSVTEIIKRLRPDFKGADRSLFEEGTVPEQCEGVLGTRGNVVGEICWLCGFAMNMYEVEGTGKTNGVDTKDLNTYMSQPSLDRASCEHKLPIKAAHYFQLMYQKLSKRNGQMSADQFERIKTLYGNAHAFCNYVKSEDLFLESVLGVKTFGEFKVNFIRIAGVNRPPTGISEDGYLKKLLMSVRKRDSSTKAISGLLSGNRFYYWGSQVTRMTGTGATHYRNGVMYRIHKMEDFKQAVASQYVNPRPTQTVARDDPGVNIPYTEFKSPSNKTVRKWLYEQATNIVGGLNELRVLLNSERDKLYTEGLQVINRKPFRENLEWWGLVVPYIEANPTEGEDFKHGLHLPLKDQIPEPKYKKPQLVWQPGQLGPQKSGETDRITYDDDSSERSGQDDTVVSRMPSAAAPAPPPQYDDNELLNVERNPLDESFNYDELLQLPGYTNTQGGGGGGRVSVIIRRRSDARTTKKNKKRRTIEVRI